VTRPLLVLANSTLVITALVASISIDVNDNTIQSYLPPPGVLLDGAQVGNIYAYDADGKRITGVRLFAQDGRPLNGDPSFLDSNGDPTGLDVNGNPIGVVRDNSGSPLLNVYPRALVGSDPWQVTDPARPQANPHLWTPPVAIVPLASSPPTTGPATGPGPTPTPTATSTAKPGLPKSAAPTPTRGPSPSVTRSGR